MVAATNATTLLLIVSLLYALFVSGRQLDLLVHGFAVAQVIA